MGHILRWRREGVHKTRRQREVEWGVGWKECVCVCVGECLEASTPIVPVVYFCIRSASLRNFSKFLPPDVRKRANSFFYCWWLTPHPYIYQGVIKHGVVSRFGLVVCGHCPVTLSNTSYWNIKMALIAAHLNAGIIQESFWWWQCSDRYIISLSPNSIPPSPISPRP